MRKVEGNENRKGNGKRWTTWIGMTALTLGVLGLLVGPLYADDDEDDQEIVVTWTIEGCVIELEAPESIDLGSATPGEVLTSQVSDGVIEIDSTCDYLVTISLDGFTKDGQSVSGGLQSTLLAQYGFWVASVTPAAKVENLQASYTTFSNVGDIKGVCKSKESAEAPYRNNKCRLQFRVDTDLLPAGEYAAYHTVTASTP